ncbi:MAG: putative DNA binding domain-containing protein [Oscillospiraceae bacterium]|nr:putative DNA binding domain-containing protein [Oscillospiraceae bacterium]
MENLSLLVAELCSYSSETQWIEFKKDNYMPDMIGRDISALANSAVLCEKSCAYMLWGIDDKTHEIVGSNHDLQSLKKGNEELENWLRFKLSSNANFEFHTVVVNNVNVCVMIIYAAINQPVTFDKVDYIRIGSYTKRMSDYPAVQAQLWDKLRDSKFEERYAKHDLSLNDALNLVDYAAYFEMIQMPMPTDMNSVCYYMIEEGILSKQDNGLFAITNMGAILFARKLSNFPRLSRKSIRLIRYHGNNRLDIENEIINEKGYAIGFEELINYIEIATPTRETIEKALREKKTAYPMLAIREIIANAFMHQDFSITGTSPIIEIFDNRVEVTNPGTPLVDIRRIIDNPPRSRNEKLAALMRHLRMCEELGTGWDKIVTVCELAQLPAPKIELFEENTKVTIFSKIPFANISREDKLWACYLHACIKHIQNEQMTNASLRERFGLGDTHISTISRLIRESVDEKLIKPFDANTAPRYMKYVPIWA